MFERLSHVLITRTLGTKDVRPGLSLIGNDVTPQFLKHIDNHIVEIRGSVDCYYSIYCMSSTVYWWFMCINEVTVYILKRILSSRACWHFDSRLYFCSSVIGTK
jgi:hypothetical protein